MGIPERRHAEKEAVKQKIFDSASKMIIEHGYEKLSIRKLADEIEYSPTMVYHYFKNKEDIIKTIALENYNIIYKELLSIDLESMPPKEALETGLLKLAQLILNCREQFKATLLSQINTLDEASYDNAAMDLLINVLNRGVSAGDFIIDNTRFTAFLLASGVFGMVNSIVLNNIYDEDRINFTMKSYVELLVKGVTKY